MSSRQQWRERAPTVKPATPDQQWRQTAEAKAEKHPKKVWWLIQHAPPPTPPCFDSKPQWQDYLRALVLYGEPILRRESSAKWQKVDGRMQRVPGTRKTWYTFERIDYCSDCDIGGVRQLRMQDEGRCIIPKRRSEK